MRLSQDQVNTIRTRIHEVMGEGSRIWLFGSRVDDTRRGGDVDLYVMPSRPVALEQELRCRGALADALDLGVDLVIARPGEERPIERIARRTGTPL
jgi:predicted nucleotidyltransferase